MRFLIKALFALLILAHVSNESAILSKNSSFDFDIIASLGMLHVTTPKDPIFVEPAPKLN